MIICMYTNGWLDFHRLQLRHRPPLAAALLLCAQGWGFGVCAMFLRRPRGFKRVSRMEAQEKTQCPSPSMGLRVPLATETHPVAFVADVLRQVLHGQVVCVTSASSEGSLFRTSSEVGFVPPDLLTQAPYSCCILVALPQPITETCERAIDVMGSAGHGSTRNVDSFP